MRICIEIFIKHEKFCSINYMENILLQHFTYSFAAFITKLNFT